MTGLIGRTMLLEIKDLCVEFETDGIVTRAVDGVSLSLDRGQVLGLVGESGCGKSATAMSVPRLLPMPPARIMGGSIVFDGKDMLGMPVDALRRLRGARIGVIFQDPLSSLSPLHRVGRQLVEVMRLHTDVSRGAARENAVEWLGRVGIPEPAARVDAYPHELSGGMQQRVMIAMALILEPDLIIADEPTTALDVTIQAQILDVLRGLLRASAGLLLITHDMGVVSQMATHVAVMYAGQLVEQAAAGEFFSRPRHPYSVALLDAMPSAATRGQRLKAIPGQVPAAGAFPSGCRFHDRCPVARPECANAAPELAEVDGRLARCPYA
ncbi:MAG: ABC transporter ATP-binding protein [Kiritimatiellae bacterium]|nr:ABC transporter ATP-binding protein [Kiritimatiellia bacterium]MDD4025306.1 ABC transporter ATP-binding protein [Kiritimatiellia bacterium]MDD4622101.1 ABC transporter ATP-binding protein [Kiritimatiellia bacterium]